jgi:vacuolar protein sorting-associated protein 54
MRDTADLSAGRLCDGTYDESVPDRLLTQEEHSRVITKLADMITSVCDYCHERMGNLLSAGTNEKDKFHNDKDKIIADVPQSKLEEKENQTWSDKSSWLSERATTVQVCQLANMVEEFTHACEKLCGKQCTALRSAFKVIIIYRYHGIAKLISLLPSRSILLRVYKL